VISAATIRALLQGVEVLVSATGLTLDEGPAGRPRPLQIGDVSRIHFSGGSIWAPRVPTPPRRTRTSGQWWIRCTAGRDPAHHHRGDDTAFSAMKVSERAAGKIRVVHVPKTIDNDLDLDPMVDTFGYQTARHIGVELVKNLMADAKTTSRWYFVVAMGARPGTWPWASARRPAPP